MYMLRKLLLNIGDLPAQTSHILFNYLVKKRVLFDFDGRPQSTVTSLLNTTSLLRWG